MSLLIYEDQFLRLSISLLCLLSDFFCFFSFFSLPSFRLVSYCRIVPNASHLFRVSPRCAAYLFIIQCQNIVFHYRFWISAANRCLKLAEIEAGERGSRLSLAALLNFVLSLSLSLPSPRELISLLMTLLYLMLILFSTQIIYFHKNMYPFIRRAYTFTFVSFFSLSHKKNVWNPLSISLRPSPVFA